MALVKRHADFGLALEPADSGPVAGTRINDDHRRLVGIDAIIPAIVADLDDPQERVVCRVFEAAGAEGSSRT